MTLDEILTVLSQQPQLRRRLLKAYQQLGATPTSRSVSHEDELFAVPPPPPDPAVGRRERRNARRRALYRARLQTTDQCARCGRRPRKTPEHTRCAPCCEYHSRSAARRKPAQQLALAGTLRLASLSPPRTDTLTTPQAARPMISRECDEENIAQWTARHPHHRLIPISTSEPPLLQ
jgi:hypothetical protein